jgi:hypothetical protein
MRYGLVDQFGVTMFEAMRKNVSSMTGDLLEKLSAQIQIDKISMS